ncbi:MAG TPA: hypothetical protein VML56_15265, partial [Burkholderiales bacterium]|nr:hypothetical protein [Burkholderiales bacterium]
SSLQERCKHCAAGNDSAETMGERRITTFLHGQQLSLQRSIWLIWINSLFRQTGTTGMPPAMVLVAEEAGGAKSVKDDLRMRQQ